MGILATIFGSGEVIKGLFNTIDDMHTSKEEEIVANAEAKVRVLEGYEPFKIAQRLLALMFAVTFLSCFVLVLVMTLLGEANIDDVRGVIAEFWIGEIMITIVGFYFSGGAIEGVMKMRKKNG